MYCQDAPDAEKVKPLSRDDMDAIAHFYASEKQGEDK